MSGTPRHDEPTGYRVRVAGHLDDHWSPWLGDLTLTHEDDGTTSLAGVVSDQAELHGLLTKIRDLGVILISVAAMDHQDSADGARGAQSRPASRAAARAAPSDSTGR